MSTEPRPPDELDRLFGTYLKAQLPQPWPTAPVPTESASPGYADSAGRSRLTLALSLALLFGFGFFLAAGPRPAARPIGIELRDNLLPGSTAEGGKLFKTASTQKK